MTVKEQFEGSEANLRRFFDQKSSKFSRILATESQDENGDQLISAGSCDPTELAILHLLILSKELLFEESTKQLPQVSKTHVINYLFILMQLTKDTCKYNMKHIRKTSQSKTHKITSQAMDQSYGRH